jgi:thiol-disulfide isomerase/thioredoxin
VRLVRSLGMLTIAIGLIAACASPSGTARPGGDTPIAVQNANTSAQLLRFDAKTVDGKDFSGQSLAGKPAVLWFWAPWCPVVLFHSTPEEVRTYARDLPFDVVADPDKQLYEEFGVETSLRGVLDPRATAPVVKALFRRGGTERVRPFTGAPTHPTGGHLGLPADILLDPAGAVVACKYGTHAYDQWSVDELLDQATHFEQA